MRAARRSLHGCRPCLLEVGCSCRLKPRCITVCVLQPVLIAALLLLWDPNGAHAAAMLKHPALGGQPAIVAAWALSSHLHSTVGPPGCRTTPW